MALGTGEEYVELRVAVEVARIDIPLNRRTDTNSNGRFEGSVAVSLEQIKGFVGTMSHEQVEFCISIEVVNDLAGRGRVGDVRVRRSANRILHRCR